MDAGVAKGQPPSARYWQTVLSFDKQPRLVQSVLDEFPRSPSDIPRDNGAPRLAPQLPDELWKQISNYSNNFGLKTFRLVCRQWSEIGASYLYSTIYLNNYEKCWAGLVAISQSRYASFVRRIEWNYLVMSQQCFDMETWKICFPNLLLGLSHAHLIQYHEAFVSTYQLRCTLERSTSWEQISIALRALCNCRLITLSDTHSIEASCVDNLTRLTIQKEPELLHQPATWCLTFWDLRSDLEIKRVTEDFLPLLSALQNCSSVTRIAMDFWDAQWYNLASILTHSHGQGPVSSTWLGVEQLTLRTRYWILPDLGCNKLPMDRALTITFETANAFPDAKELCIEAVPAEPTELDMMVARKAHYVIFQRDPLLVKAFDDPTPDISSLVKVHANQLGLSMSTYMAARALLRPNTTSLPKLRTLRLCNLSVAGRWLLAWICHQQQFPMPQLVLDLQGTIIFINPRAEELIAALAELIAALAELNVNVLQDKAQVYSCFDAGLHFDLPTFGYEVTRNSTEPL